MTNEKQPAAALTLGKSKPPAQEVILEQIRKWWFRDDSGSFQAHHTELIVPGAILQTLFEILRAMAIPEKANPVVLRNLKEIKDLPANPNRVYLLGELEKLIGELEPPKVRK